MPPEGGGGYKASDRIISAPFQPISIDGALVFPAIRFGKLDASTTRRHGGTGLGLALVKHIVARHRGVLRVSSQPGEGAQFTVDLPFEA